MEILTWIILILVVVVIAGVVLMKKKKGENLPQGPTSQAPPTPEV